jgi:hypothetical protein
MPVMSSGAPISTSTHHPPQPMWLNLPQFTRESGYIHGLLANILANGNRPS